MNKKECRSCGGIDLKDVLSLGDSPLANNLTKHGEVAQKFPLEIKWCADCFNVQLSYVVPPEEMFKNYLYVSSTSKSFREHFNCAAKKYVEMFSLDGNSLVVDLGSNDGVFLKPMQELGVKVCGVEPAENVAKIALSNDIPTINKFFDETVVEEIAANFGKADIVTASNVFAHADDLDGIAKNVLKILKEDGTFIIEVQYLIDTIKDLTFDNIYHEHVNYWTVTSLEAFFSKRGLNINRVEHVDTHGGSIRVYSSRSPVKEYSVDSFLRDEENFGVKNHRTYLSFADKVNEMKEAIKLNAANLKTQYKKIYGYGSPAKATTALNFYELDSSFLLATIEDNALKHGKLIPYVNIPIISKEEAIKDYPDLIVVLAWNFFDEIVKSNKNLFPNTKFISIKDLELLNF
jgi:SAM-dependent methyltransferase